MLMTSNITDHLESFAAKHILSTIESIPEMVR